MQWRPITIQWSLTQQCTVYDTPIKKNRPTKLQPCYIHQENTSKWKILEIGPAFIEYRYKNNNDKRKQPK